MKKEVYQIDAFTEKRFGGNPAAVVLDAEGLTEEQMLNIAREMNLSETAFVKKSDNNEYDFHVRFFTPTEEVDLCGHATIATFYLLSKLDQIKNNEEKTIVKQKTLAGILPVEISFKDGKAYQIMMTQDKPKKIFELEDIDEISSIMGIDKGDIGLDEVVGALPMAYSTGLPDIILPVRSVDTLKKINPDFNRLKKYSIEKEVVGVHAFTFKDYDRQIISCRNFAPACGINEEAATGTSNGALGAYLHENKIIDIKKNKNLICEQGFFMDRPSEIKVLIEDGERDITIRVGGSAVIIMKGTIFLEEY